MNYFLADEIIKLLIILKIKVKLNYFC